MADKNLDEYKPEKFYRDNSKARQNGFAKFKKDGAYYFALYKDGAIALISQSYVSEAGRDNGIASVRKNSRLKARYKFDTRRGGKYGFSLKAGNGQEIAISANHNSKATAERVAGRLNGSVKTVPKAKAAPKKTAAASRRKDTTKKPRKPNDEDNYRRLAYYEKHTKGRKNGLESFKGDDGLHYFAVFENGKIRMISEGYPTTNALETGMESVKKNMKLEKRYDYRGPLKNGKYDFRLKAGNGKEIARSVWYGSAAAAATGAAYLMGKRKRVKPKPKTPVVAAVTAAAAVPAMAASAKPVLPQDKDDDYLKCEDYHGHPVTDTAHNLALFSHANNKEYFVIYDDNGDVLIRSEGFESISKRSSELAAVLRLKDNRDNYERKEKNGYFMDVLKDENGREVGRSCLRKIAPVATAAPVAATGGSMGWGWLKWLLLGLLTLLALFFLLKSCNPKATPPPPPVTCWDGSEADTRALCPKRVTCWDGSHVKDIAACPVEPVTCWDGSKAATQAECPVETTTYTCPDGSVVGNADNCPVEPTTYTCWDGSTVRDLATCPPEPITPIGGDLACSCAYSSAPIFTSALNIRPKNVTQLGTNPQFGYAHGQTPEQFFQTLKQRYDASSWDANYLDYVFRSMGYENGFSSATAADFSEQTLQNGVTGMLGIGDQHHYRYSRLNVTDPADLQSFRIKSKNGCDINFMKSCGNYMYVCQ